MEQPTKTGPIFSDKFTICVGYINNGLNVK